MDETEGSKREGGTKKKVENKKTHPKDIAPRMK